MLFTKKSVKKFCQKFLQKTLVERKLFLLGVWLQPTSQLKARILPCILNKNNTCLRAGYLVRCFKRKLLQLD